MVECFQMNGKSNNLITGTLCALGCETLYGLSYIFTKQVTEKVSTFQLLGWRFLLSFVFMSICVALGFIKIDFKRKSIKALFAPALFSPVTYFIGETFGISFTTASESGIFLACIPAASLITSTLILKRKPTKLQTAGISITLGGIFLTVFAAGMSASFSIIGYVFLLMAVASYAFHGVGVEKAKNYTSTEITYVMLLAGAAVFSTLALLEAGIKGNFDELIALPFKNSEFLAAVLYQGLGCSVLAFFLSNVAIINLGLNRASSFIGVSSVVSIIAGAVLLKENLTVLQIIGAAIIIAGVYVANKKED